MAATYYSLVESAKLADVSPKDYLLAAARAARENPGAILLPEDFKALPDTA